MPPLRFDPIPLTLGAQMPFSEDTRTILIVVILGLFGGLFAVWFADNLTYDGDPITFE